MADAQKRTTEDILDYWLRQFLSPKEPNSFQRFPTKHPFVDNEDGSRSNVMLGTFEIGGRHYVIPTMVEGKQLEGEQAVDVARQYGLEHYPSFKTEEEANSFAETEHGNIDEEGVLHRKESELPLGSLAEYLINLLYKQ